MEGPATPLDLCSCGPLTFAQPDLDTFRCLALALKAARTGGTAGAILNGANEAAVSLFLDEQSGFWTSPTGWSGPWIRSKWFRTPP